MHERRSLQRNKSNESISPITWCKISIFPAVGLLWRADIEKLHDADNRQAIVTILNISAFYLASDRAFFLPRNMILSSAKPLSRDMR